MKGNKLRITIVHAILFSVCLVACSQPKIVESLSEINCSDWARPYVDALEAADLIPQTMLADNSLKEPITRENFCELIVAYMKAAAAENNKVLKDEPEQFTDTDNPAVRMANSMGVVTGTSETSFAPYAHANREQIATMIGRAEEVLESQKVAYGYASRYLDSSEISDFAMPYVKSLSDSRAINGFSDLTYRPKAEMSEEQVIKIIAIQAEKHGLINISPSLAKEMDVSQLLIVEMFGKWGCIDKMGTEVIAFQFDSISRFTNNGLAAAEANGKMGFINATGQWGIAPRFDEAFWFSNNGLAAVKVGDKMGYINDKGQWVIEPKFDYTISFSDNGLALVENDKKYGYINKSGVQVIPLQFEGANSYSYNGLASVKVDGKWGCIDETGRIVIEPEYDRAVYFSSNGLAPVVLDGKSGYIDKTGAVVIPLQYEEVDHFSDNGLAAVKSDGKEGYIDKTGKVVIPFQYDYAFSFAENGLALVAKGGKCGFVDKTGKVVIPFEFSMALDFNKCGLARVEIDGRIGYINDKGEVVIAPIYTNGL